MILIILALLVAAAIGYAIRPSRSQRALSNATKSAKLFEEPKKKFSIIIPAYNEIKRLPPVLEMTINYCENKFGKDWEVIVVDDKSKDKTAQYVIDLKHPNVQCLKLPKNLGKGGAVKAGILQASGEYILFQDADGASELNDLELLLRAIQDNGVAIGSRAHLVGEALVKRSPIRNLLMRGFHFMIFLLGPSSIADTQCGFKLFTRSAARRIFPNMHCNGWIFDVEILLLAQWSKINVQEVGIAWQEMEGSKVNLVFDAMRMARDLFIIRGNYATGKWRLIAE